MFHEMSFDWFIIAAQKLKLWSNSWVIQCVTWQVIIYIKDKKKTPICKKLYSFLFPFTLLLINMNALIALLHFCEVHGPCVVYCTQTIHKTPTNSPLTTTTHGDVLIPPLKSMTLVTEETPSAPILPPILRKNSLCSIPPKTLPGSCAACTAQLPLVNNGHGVSEAKSLYTLDEDDASVSYIGTKQPQQNHLYKAVRLACVRR